MVKKFKRTLTSILPVSKRRIGSCQGCGECCKLPYACPFLKYNSNGTSHCSIYTIRPLNCRKYPRTASECITHRTCGFRFVGKGMTLSERISEKIKKIAFSIVRVLQKDVDSFEI